MRNIFGLLGRQHVAAGPPFDQTGILGWYMGDKGVTAPSNLVTAAADQSAAGNNTAASGSLRPALVPAGLNGLPYFQFDGVANALSTGAVAIGSGNELSFFAVLRENSLNAYANCFGYGGTGSDQITGSSNNNTNPNQLITRASVNSLTQSTNDYGTSWHYISLVMRAGGTEQLWIDGVSGLSSSIGGTLVTTGKLSMGAIWKFAFGSFSGFANVDIAEIIFFNVNKEASRTTIESYLKMKWGL